MVAAVVVAVMATACGSGTSLTGPSNSIPNVAGNYAGTTTVALPELGQTLSCSSSTSVTQSGSTINVAPLSLGGQCNSLSVPIGQLQIDATGAILGVSNDTSRENCGVYAWSGSGGFFGRDLRMSVSGTSRTCFNVNITINLTRR
jgi:hypothetical protein